LKTIIHKIHLESEEFDPKVLLEALHKDTSLDYYRQYQEKLEESTELALKEKKNILNLYVEDVIKSKVMI